MKELLLYTTSGCHLCEQAQEILRPVLINVCAMKGLSLDSIRLCPVEISEDAALVERYGVRIPVIQFSDDVDELDWPFDAESAFVFLSKQL
jgi:hypothetical protein